MNYPILCAWCLREGKPMPGWEVPLAAREFREITAVTVWRGHAYCSTHWARRDTLDPTMIPTRPDRCEACGCAVVYGACIWCDAP